MVGLAQTSSFVIGRQLKATLMTGGRVAAPEQFNEFVPVPRDAEYGGHRNDLLFEVGFPISSVSS
jgi:hypothetical protein